MAADNISNFYNAFKKKYNDFATEEDFRGWLGSAKREDIDNLYGAFSRKYNDFGSADDMVSYLGWSENSGVESQGQDAQAPAQEQTAPAVDPAEQKRNAAEGYAMFNRMRESSRPATSTVPVQAKTGPAAEPAQEEQRPEEPKGNPFPSRNELGREKDQLRKKIADLEQVLEAVKGDADFVDEYEGRKSERDRRAKELGSLRGDIRGSGFDPSQLDEDNRYISENERRYGSALEDRKAARQVQADIDELKGQLQLIENTENRRRVEAKKKATSEKLDDEWRKAVMSGPRGSIPYNPGTKEEREDGVNIAAANSLYSQAEQAWNQGSKYDEGYKGNDLEKLWTAVSQFASGAANEVDLGTFTMGLTEGSALMTARRVGEKYNGLINSALKDMKMSDGDMGKMMSRLESNGTRLEELGAELDRANAELETMKTTAEDMVRRGDPKANEYAREYQKKVEAYDKLLNDEYKPLRDEYEKDRAAYQKVLEAVDSAVQNGLTDGERSVLDALEEFTNAKANRAGDVSTAAKAGAGAEQSAEFMLDFILTGGIAKAGTKAATKIATRRMLKKVGAEALKDMAVKPGLGLRMATDAATAAVRTAVMVPRNLKAYGEQLAEYTGKDELGRINFDKSRLDAALNTAVTQYIEYWSEGFGEYFGEAEQALFRNITKAAPKTAIGQTLKGYRGSIGKYLDYGKFDGMFNEMLEEVVGSSLNALSGWLSNDRVGDKDAMKEFFAGENLATLALSFLPMSAIGAATNLSAYHKMKTRYDEGAKMLDGFVNSGLMSREEVESLTAGMTDMTPEQIKGNIVKLADKVRERNGGALPSDFAKNLLGYVEGSFAQDLRHDEWEESREKMAVVGAYTDAYARADVRSAWDADQAEAEAKGAALSAGFTEEELDADPFILGQDAAALRDTEPERSQALTDYAVAKARNQGLRNGFMNMADHDAEEYENNVRQNLNRDGIIVMATMNENGKQIPVFVMSEDAVIGEDGKFTTPTGEDGLVTIRRGEDSELETVKASELSGADVQMTDFFVTEQTDALKASANEFYEAARKAVSPAGKFRMLGQRVGTNVVVSGNGAFMPVRVERMKADEGKVVISGDKDAIKAVATATNTQSAGGTMLEVNVADLWPHLSREADGSLTAYEQEQTPGDTAGKEAKAEAPARTQQSQAPKVNPDELPDTDRTVMIDGKPTTVHVDSVGGDGVWYTYRDEQGVEREGDMSLDAFTAAIVDEQAQAPAAENPVQAPAQTNAFPVDEKTGKRVFDHPSVTPERAYRELMDGVAPGSKNEANRVKFIGASAEKAAKALADAQNKIAGLQARRDAVDEWDINDDEDIDAFEARQNKERAKFDAQIAEVEAQVPELQRKAAHWESVRGMANAVSSVRREARLSDRAQSWTNRTGINVRLFRSPEEVDDAQAKEEIEKGKRIGGWYNPDTGEVGLYLPNLTDESEVDKTFIHEVIAHKGLRELLDKKGKTGNYNALCDKVWDQLMSEKDRQKYLDYNSHLKGKGYSEQFLRRAAADEWIANYSETLGLEENKNLFDKFVEFVKEFLDRILGEDAKISKEDIATLLRSSLAMYETERKADKKAELFREGIASETQAAQLDDNAIRFNIKTEESVEQKIRDFAKSKEGRKLGWTDAQIDSIIGETADLMRAIHAAVSGDKYYDEWAQKDPTVKVDWRDGVEKPTVTWSRANIEYKYDMSADLLCINNEGLETVLASPTMVELMLKINETAKDYKEGFTSDDYLRLYETLRDMGFVVPCKGCFDAAVRLKSLPTVSKKFVELVNKIIDERNADPVAFDRKVRAKAGDNATISGLPGSANNMEDAIRTGVVGDNLTEHISWAQLMSAEGQTKALSDWGGIFRAWERTGAGRPKDKLLPEPWSGDIVNTTTTIIGKFGEKTPSYRAISVNQGTGLRRNSHSEFRPLLAIDEIQFMREAFIRGLTVFKYMKELDDVRLFGKLGVKFNMSFFPAFVEGAPAAGLDANGNYIAAEESVGGREFEYVGEDGKTHYDGMKGWQEAMKYINKDVSLSSVIFSIPHLIKAFTDVPTKSDPRGIWGSLIPFHATGATFASLKRQGLGEARALGHSFEEALTDYGKGVTNFEAVQNDMFGEGWEVVEGKKAGTKVEPGHKLEFSDGTHYYNAGLGLHLFRSKYIFDSEMDEHPGEFASVKEYAEKYGHPYSIDYNDKVRELGTGTAYQDASDYYIDMLRSLGLVPRFDFEVPEDIFLMMCSVVNVDPNHPKLGWKGEGHSWSPVDSEAYYSLWCDYGMIDPDTGMLAPHNPVGIVDAEGNRTFQLPENTVDIIKDGVARYSERKDREAARELDAIEEFARRTVAEGKLKQEDADAIISQARAEQENPDVAADGSWTHFRKLEDPAKIEELENGEWEEEAYRAVQFVPDPNGEWEYDLGDGKGMQKGNVYPPMSAQTEKGEWRNPIQKGVIEESEEAPGKAFLKNGKWVFRLHKGNGKYVDAAYNPYIHSSDTMLNDQFSEAQSRGNLVVMRVAVPKSELDGENPYRAEKAHDHVGRHDWKAGPIQGELTGTRTVYLSRYDKPMELMPIEKVGESVAKMLEGQVETMPTNVVWPQLRSELEKRGMEFVETDNQGKLVSGENAGKTWKQVYGKKKPAKKKPKKSDAGSTRFRVANESQLGLVSNAGAALDRIKMEKATPEQWVKMLEKEGGLKAGEDKWLGLSDWLKSQDKKTLTKQEIADYIAEHRIQIEETDYAEEAEKDYSDAIASYQNEYAELVEKAKDNNEKAPYVHAYNEMADLYGERFLEAFELDGETIAPTRVWAGDDSLSSDAMYFLDLRKENSTKGINPTRLDYTTEGLDNKREIALTVQTIEPWNQGDKVHFGDAGEGRAVAWVRFGDTTTKPEGSGMYSRGIMDELERKYGNPRAYEKMSDEDVAKAYFADYVYRGDRGVDYQDYKRMFMADDLGDERAKRVYPIFEQMVKEAGNPGNRVLVIDEIQSKRHQEGREKGYVSDELKKLEKEYDEFVEETAKKHNVDVAILDEVATPEEIDRAVEYDRRIQELRKQSGTVPAAPFEKNWHELAMKRMLRLAAEEGYDYVAWTTGDQQAERYNIGGVVDRIVSGVDSRGKRHLVLYPKDRAFIAIEHDGNGNIVNVQGDNGAFSGAKNISDIIGKELAEQALQVTEPGSSKEFSGDGLKYGGEGMKGFYDDILPRFMNKYGKKWGVKVSDITLPNVEEAGRTMHAVPVTQEMKDSVMEGQTMFRITPEQDKEYMDAVDSGDMKKAQQMVRDAFKAAYPDTKFVDENGDPKVLYHGTDSEFTEFRPAERGLWFTEKMYADNYGKALMPVFLNAENLGSVGDREDWKQKGYDGWVDMAGPYKYFTAVVADPSQVKSAEPVARDDAGNVIPLSERFNEKSNDIRFSIRGVVGAMNDEAAMHNLDIANELEKDGKDAKTIWAATGWERGADGKWRNEIKDATPKVIENGRRVFTVKEIIDAPELFEAYPQLQDYKVVFKKIAAAGDFDAANKTINLDTDYNLFFELTKEQREQIDKSLMNEIRAGKILSNAAAVNYRRNQEKKVGIGRLANDGMDTIMHELQHAIQSIEGFSEGGTPSGERSNAIQEAVEKDQNLGVFAHFFSRKNSAQRLLNAGKEKIISGINGAIPKFKGKDRQYLEDLKAYLSSCSAQDFVSLVKSAARLVSNIDAKTRYNNLAGEVEARNVERRRYFSDDQRKTTPPSETEDVPRDEQILRSGEDAEKAERIATAERIVTGKMLDAMPQAVGTGVMQVSRDKMPAGHKTDKGYYDPATNTVSVCMDNVLDERDAVATVLHETVGRKGLRGLFGDRYREFMAGSYAALDAEGRAWVNGYILRNGLEIGDDAILRGMEEYMARLSEREADSVLDAINGVLSEAVDLTVGTEGFSFTNRELAYMLRASYEHLKDPNWLDTPAGKAKDTLWKRELGINETDPNRPTDPDGPDAGTRFRIGGANATTNYEERMKERSTIAKMEIQNADIPVKVGYEEILKEKYGSQWEEKMKGLRSDEDYLMRHNLSSSRADTENHNFKLFHFDPMIEKVREVQRKVAGNGASKQALMDAYERVLDYLYAVSGLERNEWERNNGGEAKDWSGLTSLTGHPKEEWQEAEDDARALVDAFKAEVGDDALLDELWDSIRSCTDFSLDHAYKYGLLTKAEYERLRGTDTQPRLWNYYLPLRGFTTRTAEEEYDYAGIMSSGSRDTDVVKDAKGRWTEADNPLAYIANIAQKEIVQGNENWARQALLRFVRNVGENSLLSERKPWIVKVAGTKNKWVPAEPEEDESIEDFETRMQEAKKTGDARQGRKGLELGLVMANKGHRNQHLIHVKVGGEDRMIWVNGNPALARAVSGAGKEPNYEMWRKASRVISNTFTTYSIDFTAKNLLRDSIYSLLGQIAKEDRKYMARYFTNWLGNGGFTALPMIRLAALWDSGELQRKDPSTLTRKERMFIDFMHDGGQTGYTIVRNVEKMKRAIEKTLAPSTLSRVVDGAKFKVAGVDVPILGIYTWGVRTLNEAFELLTRFTAYETSRDMGRDGQRSAYDAKEISVNFNRRGAQSNKGFWGHVAAYFGGTHYFFNAGIQGFDNFLRLYKTNWKAMTGESIAIMALGFFTPMINALLAGGGDGDDDKEKFNWYWNLPEWVRRNNIVLGYNNKYLAIPLPVEFRALYGIGDITNSVFKSHTFANPSPGPGDWGKLPAPGNVFLDILSTASGILPVNPIEGYNGKSVDLKDAVLRSIVPDLTIFGVDWLTNQDYTGRQLKKDNMFTPQVPDSQGAYASTPKALVEACQWMGEHLGVDLAPGVVRDFLSNYGGGFYKFAEDMSKQMFTDKEHPRRWDDIPFLSGFTGHIDEDRTITYVNNVLNEYKDVAENIVKKMNLYNRSDNIKAQQAFVDTDELPAKAKVQALLSGKDYELAKMYYLGMEDEHTGEYARVEHIYQSGKSKGKRYTRKEEIKIPGVKKLKKTWNDAREYWASLPKGTPEEAEAYAAVTNAWHEYYNAAADLAQKLMDYEYGKE